MAAVVKKESQIDWSKPVRMTEAEYLEFEEASEEKHEFYDGFVRPLSRIIGMAGGSEPHSLSASNLLVALAMGLRGKPCRVYGSDLQVKPRNDTRYSYPDVSVVCEDPEYDPNVSGRRAINNPILIVEVLSPSTEGYDRGIKFERYRKIESLQEYVIVDSRRPLVQSIYRDGKGGWSIAFANGLDETVVFRSVGVEVPMREIYRNVELLSEEDEPF
jgi:Uma2 family endonuclease